MNIRQIKYWLDHKIFKHPYKIASEVIDYLDPTRFVLRENFAQIPALNAVLALADASGGAGPNAAEFAAYTIANKNFEVQGTNMTTALATAATTGGLTLTTAGADADQAIVCPHLDTKQTQWASTVWGSSTSSTFETVITTGSSVAKTIIWAGFKLTNDPTIATDNDQCYFRYSSADSSGAWQIITSRSGTDTTTVVDTGQSAAPAASTTYRLRIAINSARQPRFWINDKEIFYSGIGSVFPALTATITFKPYIGVMANGTTPGAKAITVRGLICSRT